jgi:hypothetical protein
LTGRQSRALQKHAVILQHSSYATKTIITTATISTLDFQNKPIQMIHYWSNTLYSAHRQWKEKMSPWDQVCNHKDISYRNQDWLVRFQATAMAISCARHVCDLWGWAMILYIFFSVNNQCLGFMSTPQLFLLYWQEP